MEMVCSQPHTFSWKPEQILRAGEFLPPSKLTDDASENALYETLAKTWCELHQAELDAGDFESALQRAEATGSDLAQTAYVRAVIERLIRSGNWEAVQPVIDRIFPLGAPKKEVAIDVAAIFGRFDGRDLCLETYALRAVQYGRLSEAMRVAEMIEERGQKYRTVNKIIELLIDKPTATNVLYGFLPDSVLGGETTETTIPKPQYTDQELRDFCQWYAYLDQKDRSETTERSNQTSNSSDSPSAYTRTKHLIATADLALSLGLRAEAEKWYDQSLEEMLQIVPELRKQREELTAQFWELEKTRQPEESNGNTESSAVQKTDTLPIPLHAREIFFPEEIIDRLIAIPLEAEDYDTVADRLRQCEERGVPISCRQKIQLLCRIKRWDDAMRIVDENMSEFPEMKTLKMEILRGQKRLDEMIQMADEDGTTDGIDVGLLICALAEDGQVDRAIEQYHKYQKVDPDFSKYLISELPYSLQERLLHEMEPQQKLEYWIRQAYDKQSLKDRSTMEKSLLEAIRILESIDHRCEKLDEILRLLRSR